MSGIYIPGMEMPTSCPCELLGIGYDLCCSFVGGIPARVKEYYECCQNGTRPSWCPIIPVPDHGRLIDAKQLLKTVHESRWFNIEQLAQLAILVQAAPTIIPADKEARE